MFRAHVTKASAVFLLTLTLGAVSAPARAAGFSSEPPSRWEQLAASFFGWLLKTSVGIDPDGKASAAGKVALPASSGMIDPNGTAALCLDYCGMIDPNGSH